MEGKYPIMIDDALAGTLEVTKKGAMTVFDARCKGTDKLLRLSVYGDDGEGYLGVMVPEGGEMRLRRSMSPLSMKGFPEEIVAAGPAGRGNAGHQGVAEETAAPRSGGEAPAPGTTNSGKEKETATPQTDGGKTMVDHAEKTETVPPEKAPETLPPEKLAEESCESEPCKADCGEATSPTPPETGNKPEPEEVEPPCEKRPEQEVEPSCEKCPERQEEEAPCEKPPEHQEEEAPCEKCPEPEVPHSGQNTPTAPSQPEGSPGNMEDLCWYASPDGALVCFDGVHSLIALPLKDERVPQNIPGQPRQIEGRDYLVYETKNGRIIS